MKYLISSVSIESACHICTGTMLRIFPSRGRSHSLRYPDGRIFGLSGAELLTGSKKSTFSPCALTPEQSGWNSKILARIISGTGKEAKGEGHSKKPKCSDASDSHLPTNAQSRSRHQGFAAAYPWC